MPSWKEAWGDPAFRRALLLAPCVAVPVAAAQPWFFSWIEQRPGLRLPDPLLTLLGPADLSVLIFTILYGTLVTVVALAARRPLVMVRGMHAYILLLLLRMVTMAVLTLEPPPDIIPLRDPVTQLFYPSTTPFLKDLFFSGHTATLALMVLLAPTAWSRRLAFMATCLVAIGVLVQHAHWTIDVAAAPFAVVLVWKGSALTMRACGLAARRRAVAGA